MNNKENEKSKNEKSEFLNDSNLAKMELLDQKLEDERQDQEDRLLVDFDKVISEVTSKPFTIKFQSEYYEIPNSMPLDFSMFFYRHALKRKGNEQIIDIEESKISKFIELMLGKKFLYVLERSAGKIGFELVMDQLAAPILEQWGYGTKKTIKQGKSQYTTAKKKY